MPPPIEKLPRATAGSFAAGCADAATAVVSAALPMGVLAPVELQGRTRRAATVVGCTLTVYAALSLVNGARLYPRLLGMPKGAYHVPGTGATLIPLMWAADPTIAESVAQALFGQRGGWRTLCALYCVATAVCLAAVGRR